ncbi:hypothetical protein BDA99DRAFT_538879 [Phascolomyces articulosus]|uniref:Uncharacterized protein n=1 Tax=Phascolomyces articulosus TaxID=60185 RepID=A0AAD5K752_9FUNG|nr:hypothetical protein BDA99DRAFT_538879 [Phascolomyces articulosus]
MVFHCTHFPLYILFKNQERFIKEHRSILGSCIAGWSHAVHGGRNGEKVSEALLEYRKLSIEKGERNMLDTYQEELSVNGIFLFDDMSSVYPDSSLEYWFDNDTWEAITDECRTQYPLVVLSEKTEAIVDKFSKAGKKSYNKCSNIAKELSDDEDKDNSQIRESLISIIKFYLQNHQKKADQLETAFSISAVYPLMLSFLDETRLLTRKGVLITFILVFKTDKKTPRKPENADKKGYFFTDLSMHFEYGAIPTERLLLVEIKPTYKAHNGSRPDLVKFANEMKDSLEKMIEDHIDDPEITVLGVLIEEIEIVTWGIIIGFRSTLLVMGLHYQGIYCVLPSCYEALKTLQHMLIKNAELCFLRKKKREPIRHQYVSESCRLEKSQSTNTQSDQ